MAIVLWIGLVITAQAFQATPSRQAPAVVVGLLPGVAAWGALIAKTSLHVAGLGVPGGLPLDPSLIEKFCASDIWIGGTFALEQGFIFTSMVLSAVTVCIIERKFSQGALWCAVAAALSAAGLMHSYAWTPTDTIISLSPAWAWSAAYLCMGAVLFLARWLTVPDDIGGH
jgi:AGZA family xanthine/uracil permease-like MFS transporter